MANVKFIRKETKEQINNLDIVDGQFIVCGDGSVYVDYGTERKGLGGTPDTAMSDNSTNSVQNKVIKEYVDTKTQEAKEYVDTKTKLNYIIATSTTASSLTSEFKVLLNSKVDGYGDNLTLSNNAIKIGEGISKIRISGNIFVNSPSQVGYVWGQIRKNNSLVLGSITSYANQGGFLSSIISPSIINVEQDDEITLIADSTCKGTLRTGSSNTWLMVEVIE